MKKRKEGQLGMPGRIDRELVGDGVTVGGWTVVPVARLRSVQGQGGDAVNGGGGAHVRLDPVAAMVHNTADDLTQRVEIDDPTPAALRGMAGVGLAVAGVSLAVQFWARSRRRNK